MIILKTTLGQIPDYFKIIFISFSYIFIFMQIYNEDQVFLYNVN